MTVMCRDFLVVISDVNSNSSTCSMENKKKTWKSQVVDKKLEVRD